MIISTEVKANVYLVVDDVASVRQTVIWMLGNMGAQVHFQAGHGAAALELLNGKGKNVTCIIADFMMPEMNGLGLLKAVRTGQVPVARYLPFVMLTGYDDQHLIGRAMALDADAFLLKPISKDALEEKLKRVLIDAVSEDGNHVKSVKDYEGIDVENIEITSATVPAFAMQQEEEKAKQKRVVPGHLPANADIIDEDEQLGSGVETSLESLASRSVLARNVYSESGQLLLARGQVVTPRIISRLKDLSGVGVSVKSVWIKSL